MRQRRRFVLGALATCIALAGCAGAPPEPDALPSGSGSTEAPVVVETDSPPSEEPTDTVPTPEPLPLPEYPEDLTAEDTAENAIRAAHYFIDLLNHMQSTGSTQEFEEASAAVCETCTRMLEIQTERFTKGSFLVGNILSIRDPSAHRTVDGYAWEVSADVDATDGYEVLGGKVVRTIPGRVENNFRIAVQLLESDWVILEFARGKSD